MIFAFSGLVHFDYLSAYFLSFTTPRVLRDEEDIHKKQLFILYCRFPFFPPHKIGYIGSESLLFCQVFWMAYTSVKCKQPEPTKYVIGKNEITIS